MNSITFRMFAWPNWCIETIIAKAFESGDERGGIHQAGKIIKLDQEKGGYL